MPLNYKKFNEVRKEFTKIEDMRDTLWKRCRILLNEGYEIDAYILLLATWDFAWFRYSMKKFDLKKFENSLKRINPIFDSLKQVRFERADFNKRELRKKIMEVYDGLKLSVKQTGATKIMALKNPELFIMWDTEIRKIYKGKYKKYKINDGRSAENYIGFLRAMQDEFKNIKWHNLKTPLAKAIDEYNYVLAERNRQKAQRKNKQ